MKISRISTVSGEKNLNTVFEKRDHKPNSSHIKILPFFFWKTEKFNYKDSNLLIYVYDISNRPSGTHFGRFLESVFKIIGINYWL